MSLYCHRRPRSRPLLCPVLYSTPTNVPTYQRTHPSIPPTPPYWLLAVSVRALSAISFVLFFSSLVDQCRPSRLSFCRVFPGSVSPSARQSLSISLSSGTRIPTSRAPRLSTWAGVISLDSATRRREDTPRRRRRCHRRPAASQCVLRLRSVGRCIPACVTLLVDRTICTYATYDGSRISFISSFHRRLSSGLGPRRGAVCVCA